MEIIKRDGRKEEFQTDKIDFAIAKAYEATYPGDKGFIDREKIEMYAAEVVDIIGRQINDVPLTVESVQDVVEEVLAQRDFKVGKKYVLYREEHKRMRLNKPDNSLLSDYIFVAKYSRFIPELGRRESWEETVTRVENMHLDKFKDNPAVRQLIRTAFQEVYAKRALPSMRSMQFAGAPLLQHNARMYNCSFTHVDRPEVFGQTLYLLLCGSGVGFSVQQRHVKGLPRLAGGRNKSEVRHYTIMDTIEGWSDAVSALVDSYLQGYYIEFNYHCIRPEGSPLSSGGKAPGHLPLKEALTNINKILSGAIGRKLKPIECYDIMCHIAIAVLAGGVRRSSLIALFDANDEEMLTAKTIENMKIHSHRMMANNSAVLLRNRTSFNEFKAVMDLNKECFGEPGFFLTHDPDAGINPCGEIGLLPDPGAFAFCNLTEINLAGCRGSLDFQNAANAATIIGTIQASYMNIPYLGDATRESMQTDPLLGVSLTGIMDNSKYLYDKDMMKRIVGDMIEMNKYVAGLIDINSASRITCVKPSGTSSLVLGCVGSGIHPHHSQNYFRRVTANKRENVAKYFRSINPDMVHEKPNGDLCIVFPISCGKDAITLDTIDEYKFLDLIQLAYQSWVLPGTTKDNGITHNVSATVVYDPANWEDLIRLVWDRRYSVCAMTFLPKSDDKAYPFMPREAVKTTEDVLLWNKLVASGKKVDYLEMREDSDNFYRDGDVACAGGACDIHHTDFVDHEGVELVHRHDLAEFWSNIDGEATMTFKDGFAFHCKVIEENGLWLKVKRISSRN